MPGEGFWDFDEASGGWQVNVIDMGDPALSFGITEHQYSWVVKDWQGREMASGQADFLEDAKAAAEAAYLMEFTFAARRADRQRTADGGEGPFVGSIRDRQKQLGFNAICRDCRWIGPHWGTVQEARFDADMHATIKHDDDDWQFRQETLSSGQLDRLSTEFRTSSHRTAAIPPPPEDNVSADGYWEWCKQRGRNPVDLETAAEYCSGWGEASDAKGIYEWIRPHLACVPYGDPDPSNIDRVDKISAAPGGQGITVTADSRTAAMPQTLYRGINLVSMPDYREVYLQALSGDTAGALERVLSYMASNNPDPALGIGRHWSTDKKVSKQWSKGPFGLNVLMTANWNGQGEDLDRTNTGGDWDDEDEVTLLPGTQLELVSMTINVTSIDVTKGPVEIVASPRMVTAAEPGGVLPYPETDFGYGWAQQPDGQYAATTRDGLSDMFLDIQGDWVNWRVYDDEGLVEKGNFMLGTATVEGALYRADRLLAEFDTNPAIPAKSWGYDPGYSETFPSSFPRVDFMEP